MTGLTAAFAAQLLATMTRAAQKDLGRGLNSSEEALIAIIVAAVAPLYAKCPTTVLDQVERL